MMLAVIIFHLLTFAIEIYLKEPEEIYFIAFTIKKEDTCKRWMLDLINDS